MKPEKMFAALSNLDEKMTVKRVYLLLVINHYKECTAREIQYRMGYSDLKIVRMLVEKVIKQGYVEKTKRDTRVFYKLTEQGKDVLRSMEARK